MSEQARRTITALAEKLDKLQAENAALKEQVAQHQSASQLQLNINDTLHLKLQGLQSKSAALVDALEYYACDSGHDGDCARGAIAAFKE